MTGSFTGRAVAKMVQKYAGSHPVEVEVMNDHDVIIQLELIVSVGKAARLLHGTHDWFSQVAWISCLLSTWESIENIVVDREEGRARLAELEKDQHRVQEEQERVRQEQAAHTAHLEEVLAHFGQEVQKVEDLQKNAIMAAAASAHLVTAPQSVTSVMGLHVSTKINKPPVLPHFLGVDPVPKDEGSCEQWRFQVVVSGTCLRYKYKLSGVCGLASIFIAVLVIYKVQWGHLIMGEHRHAVALLWLEHAPSIGLAIGPRHPSY